MAEDPEDVIPPQCLGETGALNFKKPTAQDLKETHDLEAALSKMEIFETPEEIAQRREALVRLQGIANKWIKAKAYEQNLPEHVAEATSGKIFTFGSYRLGVNFKGADVDSLFVVPRFITREEFFKEFYKTLEEEEEIEDLHAVANAFVPVLKMVFMGVEIDLLFARIDLMTIPSDFNLCENTETLLRNMDEKDVRSINGVRVTEDMLTLVYQKDTFKMALKVRSFIITMKVIRIWAKRRNIYANALGFLGGVSWAILVCRICQLYPYASSSMIVYVFFRIYSQWPWPKPVRLKETEYIPSLCLPVWDPRHNPTDQYHLMPILTPSYPSQNSTYNVTRSNRIIIEREIKNGLKNVLDILLRKQSWSILFDSAFFFTYGHYVVVIVSGNDKSSFTELCGLVESKLRVLVGSLETNRYVKMAHINSKAFGKGLKDESQLVRKWLIGMEFDRNANSTTSLTKDTGGDKPKLNVDLSENIIQFEKSVERGIGKEDLGNSVVVQYVKKSQLSQFISPEEMDEIKKQAAAYAVQQAAEQKATVNGANQRIRSPSSSTLGGRTESSNQLAESKLLTAEKPINCDSEESPPEIGEKKNGLKRKTSNGDQSEMDSLVSRKRPSDIGLADKVKAASEATS